MSQARAAEPDIYRHLVENARAWLFVVGTDHAFAYCSPACANITGYSPKALMDDPDLLLRIIHPDDREKYLAHRHEECPHKEDMEFRIVHRDGSWRWIAHHCQALRDDAGQLIGRSGMNRDITPRKLAEEQLRKLSLAVEQSPVSILITDTVGRIEYANAAFASISGYAHVEVLGKNPRFLQSGHTPRETFAKLWQTLLAGETWQGELINQRKNGEIYYEWEKLTPIRQADGKTTHYLAIKEDITERKRLGRELDLHRRHLEQLVDARTQECREARNAAEAATRAKSEFLSNMSHEIRTPLNGVLGTAHLLRRSGLAPEQSRLLDQLDASGHHLLSIINDILDLSKIEAGKCEIEQLPVAPANLTAEVAAMLGGRAHEKSLDIVVEADVFPHALLGDPVRLRQALLNYAANAIKFTQCGTVTLRARILEEVEDSLLARFEVGDSGVGIAPEALDRIFDAFEQADSSTSRKHGGTGLGLTIVRRLVHLMGGEVGADSTPGLGSLFWFTARLMKAAKVGAGDTPPQYDTDAEAILKRNYSGTRILLAEDEPINRMIALEFMEDFGLVVDIAENGVQAVEKSRSGTYALILMDVQMPGMGGLEATRQIRALPNGQGTPVVALTANAFAEDRRNCIEAGMDDFLAKPFVPAQLAAILLHWLRKTAACQQC